MVCTTKVLYILLSSRLLVPEDSNSIGILEEQVTGLCKGLSGASVLRVLRRYNWSYIKNRTLLATVLCWSPLADQLFQDHALLPITALSQWSQNDDLLHARLQTNPSSRSSEYIMVSIALGCVNGRSRAVILRYIDQYRQASLPD